MASLQELRALALKRTRAAGNKASRLRKQGVEVAGTEFDPRIPSERVGRLNRRQLEAYIGRVNSFTNRNTKFVGGANGAPLPKHLVAQYESAEFRRNQRLRRRGRVAGNVVIPGTGMTVEQRQRLMESRANDALRADGQWDYSPYTPHTRRVEGFASADALRQMIDLERRAGTTAALNASLQVQKARHIEWLEERGQVGMAADIRRLSDDQFDLLKHKTDYANHIKFLYMGTEDSDESVAASMRDDNLGDAIDLVSWVGTIDGRTGYANAPYAQVERVNSSPNKTTAKPRRGRGR